MYENEPDVRDEVARRINAANHALASLLPEINVLMGLCGLAGEWGTTIFVRNTDPEFRDLFTSASNDLDCTPAMIAELMSSRPRVRIGPPTPPAAPPPASREGTSLDRIVEDWEKAEVARRKEPPFAALARTAEAHQAAAPSKLAPPPAVGPSE